MPRVTSNRHRIPNGKNVGDRAVVAAMMLRQGSTYRETAKATGLSTRTIWAVKTQNVLDPRLIDAIDRTYLDRMKLRGHEALCHLENSKTLLNPPRASVLWKIVKEVREAHQQEQGTKPHDAAEILKQLGFSMSASISRIDVQITQAPASACLDVEANADKSTT